MVETIERFLTPFDCWSLWDYGLYDRGTEDRELIDLTEPAEARALLTLLDLTIGSEEGAIVPRELDRALGKISLIEPKLAQDQRYLRLNSYVRG